MPYMPIRRSKIRQYFVLMEQFTLHKTSAASTQDVVLFVQQKTTRQGQTRTIYRAGLPTGTNLTNVAKRVKPEQKEDVP